MSFVVRDDEISVETDAGKGLKMRVTIGDHLVLLFGN